MTLTLKNIICKVIAFVLIMHLSQTAQAQNDVLQLYEGSKTEWLKSLETTSSGLKYKVEKPGDGKQPEPGDLVAVHYIGMLENEEIFDNSYKQGTPLTFNHGVGQVIKGWDEALGKIREGGKITVVVPPELGYGQREVKNIPPNSTLYFQIELLEVERNENFEPFSTAGKDTLETASGIRYIIVDSGMGEQPDTTSWAYLHFTGYLPSDQIFDASILRGEPVRMNPGAGKVIPAWDEIVQLMRPDAKFHIIVPPELGYGDKGLPGVVPPASALKFDLELLHTSEKKAIKPFNVENIDTVKLDSGLQYIPVQKGKGRKPKKGSVVKIHFTGYFPNGKMFQSSLKNDKPVIFAVGQQQVIEGLDKVVKHIKPKGKIRAIIPWQMAYGEKGYKPLIPGKQDLIFDIELISVVE